MRRFKGTSIDVGGSGGVITDDMRMNAISLAKRISDMNDSFPEGHILDLRGIFFVKNGRIPYIVEYIYDEKQKPIFTEDSIKKLLEEKINEDVYECTKVYFVKVNLEKDTCSVDDETYLKVFFSYYNY